MCTRMSVYVCVCRHVWQCTCVYACMNVCMHEFLHGTMHVNIFIGECVHMSVHTLHAGVYTHLSSYPYPTTHQSTQPSTGFLAPHSLIRLHGCSAPVRHHVRPSFLCPQPRSRNASWRFHPLHVVRRVPIGGALLDEVPCTPPQTPVCHHPPTNRCRLPLCSTMVTHRLPHSDGTHTPQGGCCSAR